MLPIERKKQILSWLRKEGSIKIGEISKRLQVSEMTIYRDLKPLIEQEEVYRTSGGITLRKEAPSLPNHTCTYCHKISLTKFSIQILTLDQEVEHACCAHCGLLRFHDIENDVAQIICKDFLHDTTLNAKTAYYLFNPDLSINCCMPTVLTFGSLKNAQQFQTGFGGNLLSFPDAIVEIKKVMKLNNSCH
ncbi:DeoR/GlpR transcriptional regulator [Falsibacillus albus]|uniref:DeoR/GlpR transcriptional regulator n=1 Tax=Falsibacillus albus TaxID=2478915 RepID=A0A3L7K1D9_9BACI|nr:DeoR/GlpR transcriptional regulator [Falsibacillus albus]